MRIIPESDSKPPPDIVSRKTTLLGIRQVPEINGSQGAFIGVVVALSVLIVVCCVAVFYLLRHHEPTEQDRTARRERSRRARERTLCWHSSSSLMQPSSTLGSGSGSGSLGDKVKRVWQSTTGRSRRGGRGWIRAGSDDEWASHSDHGEGRGDPAGPHPNVGGYLETLPELARDARGRAGTDGIRVIESPSSDTVDGLGSGQLGYVYADAFPKTASEAALQRPQSPLSSSSTPVSSPWEHANMEEGHEVHALGIDERRHQSVMSSSSVWTHGSKFVEDI